MYMVVDTVTRNVLGEFESLAEAKVLFLDLVASHPDVAGEIRILTEAGVEKRVAREDVVAALEAAVS